LIARPGASSALPPVLRRLPSEAEYVAAYCRRTGREGIEYLDFYLAFNLFRLAAIIHGIKGRLARGTAASANADAMVAAFPDIARLAWSQAQRT
jgi:aminoglycoside phosphotransferase (APT) family kinase protein